eukprot:CAMPEP_0178901574 /NCGR_PEP_ID=MMETSP0786-20121207/4106_1 /TAXON_ID=186022 /ORGANISM="Thalassionema frauenfeldii, Strain CCMP 1798" /LENGTH=589 /DNA_ID=CAMNT_0020572707 /DNA_START=145 /DNA_END=1915 /DNA_ORIENTATION=-
MAAFLAAFISTFLAAFISTFLAAFIKPTSPTSLPSSLPSSEPSAPTSLPTWEPTLMDAEEQHETDAYQVVFLNIILIICVLLAYFIKQYKLYFLPESAAAMIIGVFIGGLITFFINDLTLYQFSPEFFFFVLLPPIIFEAGYSLEKQRFFANIGAIILYAVFGTIISTFLVGYMTYLFAQKGYITGISTTNPMESLLFGALISAVDPVATLSIMNNPELQCNKLLYSLVFGESVLNDAVAIVLFKTFREYFDPESPDLSEWDIPKVFLSFFYVSVMSILVGVGLGFVTSYLYKHTSLNSYANLESTLLFLFCYFCYALAESLGLSGIMALFFNGIILSHYNSHNLSEGSRHATEQIFATLATVSETIVFLYMGMGAFTGKFANWNLAFSLYGMLFCVVGRFLNIFPLSFILNRFRVKRSDKISCKMQMVLWFAGLRGAIAYALAENMPGLNKPTYVSGTLSICMMTTVVCGGFTERILSVAGMKENDESIIDHQEINDGEGESLMTLQSPRTEIESSYGGMKGVLAHFDKAVLQEHFGGSETLSHEVNPVKDTKIETNGANGEIELENIHNGRRQHSDIKDGPQIFHIT